MVDVSDAHDYLATRRAMDIVGISAKEQVWYLLKLVNISYFLSIVTYLLLSLLFQEAIFRVVAAILHLGNIVFTKGKDVDSSVPKDDKAKFHLKMTSELLMYSSCIRMVLHMYTSFYIRGLRLTTLVSGVIMLALKMHYVSVS